MLRMRLARGELTEIAPELPSEETILALGEALLESTKSWKQGKTFNKVVKTSSRPKGPQDGAPWHCRVSEHAPEDATFDEFWSKLGEDKANNEMQCVSESPAPPSSVLCTATPRSIVPCPDIDDDAP